MNKNVKTEIATFCEKNRDDTYKAFLSKLMPSNRFALCTFPFGHLRIEYEDGAITKIRRESNPRKKGMRATVSDRAYWQINEYLAGKRHSFDFPYLLKGTAFQTKVWKAVKDIPFGETRTYGEVATAIGAPHGARAVGNALNKNPLLIVVPCHRVVSAEGRLGGYAGGLDMKMALLQTERTLRHLS